MSGMMCPRKNREKRDLRVSSRSRYNSGFFRTITLGAEPGRAHESSHGGICTSRKQRTIYGAVPIVSCGWCLWMRYTVVPKYISLAPPSGCRVPPAN